LGVGPGDAVATLMGKSAELVVALLGIWRRGAVHVPLFTAFAPAAISFRLARSGAMVVVADEDQRALHTPTPAGCISLRRCPRPPAARFSDTSFAGNVADPLRRDTARAQQVPIVTQDADYDTMPDVEVTRL